LFRKYFINLQFVFYVAGKVYFNVIAHERFFSFVFREIVFEIFLGTSRFKHTDNNFILQHKLTTFTTR